MLDGVLLGEGVAEGVALGVLLGEGVLLGVEEGVLDAVLDGVAEGVEDADAPPPDAIRSTIPLSPVLLSVQDTVSLVPSAVR